MTESTPGTELSSLAVRATTNRITDAAPPEPSRLTRVTSLPTG